MKLTFVALFLTLSVARLDAQPGQVQPILPPILMPSAPQQIPKLHLDDWRKIVGPTDPPTGRLFYFDYTKWFEWLLPKKHPIIPRDCDPMYFLDSLRTTPPLKQDSVPAQKEPV